MSSQVLENRSTAWLLPGVVRDNAKLQGCLYEKDAPQVGWPTLQLFSFYTQLKAVNVNVLGITSRKKTRILKPQDEIALAEEAGSRLAGRICFAKCVPVQMDFPCAIMHCDCINNFQL